MNVGRMLHKLAKVAAVAAAAMPSLVQAFIQLPAANGSVHAIVDGAGAVVNRYAYDSFGVIDWDWSYETVPNRYAFQGREYDAERGDYHFRNRVYMPEWGCFSGPDMNLAAGPYGEPHGMMSYVFCGNDPWTYADPMGLVAKQAANEHRVDVLMWADKRAWYNPGKYLAYGYAFGHAVAEAAVDVASLGAYSANDRLYDREAAGEITASQRNDGIAVNTASRLVAVLSAGTLAPAAGAAVGGSVIVQGAVGGAVGGAVYETTEKSLTRTGYAVAGIEYEQTFAEDARDVVLATGGGAFLGALGGLAQTPSIKTPANAPIRGAGALDDLATTPLNRNITGVADDALVHFSSEGYSVIKPGAGGETFTFRYGDIKHLTPKQIETVIGPLSRGGQAGGVRVMHVLEDVISGATRTPGAVVSEIPEYILTKPSTVSGGFVVR